MANKKPNKTPGVHVTWREEQKKWAVGREGADRASSLHDTQKQAEKQGRTTARNEQAEFYLHGKNHRIRERDSYGTDPNPPKDKK